MEKLFVEQGNFRIIAPLPVPPKWRKALGIGLKLRFSSLKGKYQQYEMKMSKYFLQNRMIVKYENVEFAFF